MYNINLFTLAGTYEYPPGRYKHVYFNATTPSLSLLFLFVVNTLIWFKAIERICRVVLGDEGNHEAHRSVDVRAFSPAASISLAPLQRSVRWSMALLLILDIYPHYYSWWSFFIYINDGKFSNLCHIRWLNYLF